MKCHANQGPVASTVPMQPSSGCGWQNEDFHQLSKGSTHEKNEFRCCRIEITKGIVILTPSAMHLTGLPHQGSPLPCSYPSASTPVPQNVAASLNEGADLKADLVRVNVQKNTYIGEKTRQK
jgi:hypothetical protein